MEVIIGCDNAAVGLKEAVLAVLEKEHAPVEDFGCFSPEDPTPYPIIAKKVCEEIERSGFSKKGILLCGTGLGMSIAANKCKGIRACVCHDIYSAERSVLSNNANVLCMGARVIGPELAKRIVEKWMELEFSDGPSTAKIREIEKIEKENFKEV